MQKILLLAIVLLASFLLSYLLPELMPFIGDQGWFYLSAREMSVYGQIPLVGIASSHPWLHQGPLWTYLLALVLPLFQFNPLAGGYVSILIGIATILLLYKVTSEMFGQNVALIAAFLYTTSPLIILYARMPYHTAPIPFFIILFLYSLWKLVHGKSMWLIGSVFSLAVLYNLELATIPFWFIFISVLAYGIWKKEKWFHALRNKKVLILSLVAFLLPMLPILIYDSQNNFPQTFKFALWMGYKVLVFFGYPPLHAEIVSPSWVSVFSFVAESYKRLIFVNSGLVACIIFLLSFGSFYKKIIDQIRRKKYQPQIILLGLILTIPILAYIAARTPSEAYLPMLFPSVILVTALWLSQFMRTRLLTGIVLCIVVLLGIGNVYIVLTTHYLKAESISYKERLVVSKQVVSEARGRSYNLVGKGEGSKFESFTMNYQYLTWWLGNPPTKTKQKLQFTIAEEKNKIRVIKEEKK